VQAVEVHPVEAGLLAGGAAVVAAAVPTLFDASEAEPSVLLGAAEGAFGVASGDQPQPSPSVGEDEAMEGEKR